MAQLVSDLAWATLTIWMEARGEPYAGKLGVAEVIRNRMRRSYNSDGTLVGTVLTPVQFSGWNTHDVNRIVAARLDEHEPMLVECQRAWGEAMFGMSNTVRGAVLYYNPAGVTETPAWAVGRQAVVVLGRHHFFLDTPRTLQTRSSTR